MGRPDGLDHGLTAAVGHVDVDEHDVGSALGDQLDGGAHLVGLADDLDRVAELGAHAGAEEMVVVDQEDAHLVRPRARALLVGSTTVAPALRHDQLDLGALARRARG